MSAKKTASKLPWITLIVVIAATAYGAGPGHWFARKAVAELRGAPVRRGPMRITVVQRGNLAAKDSVSIKSEIEGQTTILFLIQEGTFVKKDDLLVQLDASDLIEKKVSQEINFQNADAAYTKARAQYEIQESQNLSDIELAERKLKFAQIDQEKYLKGDLDQLIKEAADKILLAEQKRTQSENTFNWSKSLAEKGFLTKSELDRDDLDFQSANVQLSQAIVAKKLLEAYDDPRKKTELDANLKEAERGLERSKLRALALIADFEAGMKSSQAKLELEREKLNKYVDQIGKARIVSKVGGMVVYTRQEGGRMGMGEPVQEGTQVRERQEILTIPRTGGMIVEASIHESVLKQVAIGSPCSVSVDALPGQQFQGKVQFVALLPDKGSWWANPNQRLYRSEISIDEIHPEMRPGMSCGIEILTGELPDTLYVPLQSVFANKGETIAFVALADRIEQRKVEVGKNNEKWVEIKSGLSEGEEVLLSPPPGFTPQGTDEGEHAINSDHMQPQGQPAAANGAAPAVERQHGDHAKRPGMPGGMKGESKGASSEKPEALPAAKEGAGRTEQQASDRSQSADPSKTGAPAADAAPVKDDVPAKNAGPARSRG